MVIGAVLLLSGGALRDTSVTLVGVLTLAGCWLPIWYVRRH